MSPSRQLQKMFSLMFEGFGPQHWWPGETPLEVVVGAILTQNTAWTNVEKAIGNLKKAGFLSNKSQYPNPNIQKNYLEKLNSLAVSKLARLIRPAGYFNIKARRLKNFIGWVVRRYGSLEKMFETPLTQLRQELLGINGIGPETADSILLYGGNKPSFVVDAYTKRILSRHYLAKEGDDYHTIQSLFTKNLKKSVPLYNEYHALFVRVGKELCKKRKPLCSSCPLQGFNWPGGKLPF